MSQTTKILLGSGVILLIILGWYALSTPEKKSKKSKMEDKDYMSFKNDPTTVPLGETGHEMIIDDAEAQLEFYKKWSQYPPFSRPLFKGQVDLTDPYNGDKPPISVISTPAQNCQMTKDGTIRCDKPAVLAEEQCHLNPERNISVGKKDFKVTLYCNDSKGQKLPISKIESKVYTIVFQDSILSLPVIHFGDDGSNGDEVKGDNLYTFLVRPTSNDWGDMFLEVNMEVSGKKHNQRATWYSTPHTVATMKNSIREVLKDGHLFITVPVTVNKKGFFHFDANLQAEDGTYIATSSWEGDLEGGEQKVEFQFFGKIIRDTAVDGPFIVRNIRGKRNNSPVTPSMVNKAMDENREISGVHKEPMWEYIIPLEPYKTQTYVAKDFSQEEWNSKEKEERIKLLSSMIHKK